MPVTTAEAPTAPQPAQEGPDVTGAYMRKIERHLALLPASDRLPFLSDMRLWWIAEYDRWTARMDAGNPTATDLTCRAVDFTLTIAALGAAVAQEQRAATPKHAQDGWTAGPAGIVP